MSQGKHIPPPRGFRDPRALAGLSADTPLLVALSGGADSVALLAMLAAEPPISALHVHHGIRGAEADRDADFCRTLCDRLHIPLTVLHIDAPALASQRGVSLETAARDGRYQAMTAHMTAQHIPLLVTAHHADDQLETMLQHLLRGSGLAGLCGIPACRPLGGGLLVARPLLQLTRQELRDYLQQVGLDFVQDSTNGEGCCTRNRLRLEVMPVLEELYPKGSKSAARCAEALAEDESYLREAATAFLMQEGKEPSVAALAALPPSVFARVMQQLLPTPPERVHIEALAELCRRAVPHSSLSLPQGRVAVENGRLVPGTEPPAAVAYHIPLTLGIHPLTPLEGVAVVCDCREASAVAPVGHYRYEAHIPLPRCAIRGTLYARPREEGDKLLQGGMHKAVRRLPGLSPLPPDVRARMPLLCDDEGVLAVPFCPPRDGASGKSVKKDICVHLYFN
ncbi:MAG: tRNA lysidine(34) synthetase TilS [Clostridia bacterium]|nr:tRNA lysidine(34) synthetase TilS [Clostridia bacterium]